MPELKTPSIPETITVHLGPPNSPADNVTLSFPDYIKNVASSEIFPTWPEAAIRANVYAQVTFALNRVFTEWYRSRGYPFDITSSTQYDQAFVYGRDVFNNISNIVDEIFNNYVVRRGTVEPLFTQFCNGTSVTCQGLSQWGTVTLANRGYTPYEMLQYYYGSDIEIVRNAPVEPFIGSYPGTPFGIGTSGNEVHTIQTELNRIADNYPAIPKISPANGFYRENTSEAVRVFQGIFGLPQTGVVNKATWYQIKYIYVAVKNLAELTSEGLRPFEVQEDFPEQLRPGDLSLYVGIPFCPTRCTYCSFVSRTVGKKTELLEPYLAALLSEIRQTGLLLRNSGHRVRTLYIGGGTPTTLTAQQLARLMDAVNESFDLSDCIEYTVEGGRPDTLNAEKLQTIKAHGANRMSINPQTMEDAVLRTCGRPHSAADVVRAYREAVEAGFDAINMDLIAGLPQDTVEGFCRSLDQGAALNPSNITVHTLALKKGADLFEKRANLPSAQDGTDMGAYANEALSRLGYKPYYLYRQKYMSGSFENTGWCRPGYTGLYNIYMMEELHTILSLGGGGMNKINLPEEKLARYHNPKIPQDYISRIDTILQQKDEIFSILRGLREQNP